jgi:hypothetical protein
MLLNSSSLDTAVLNGAASNTQSLAASVVALCSTSAQTVSVTKNLAFLAVSSSSSSGGVVSSIPLGGAALSSASAAPAVTHVAYVFAGSSSFDVSVEAALPMTKLLGAFRSTGGINNSVLGGFVLGDGESFVSAKSSSVASLLVIRSLVGNTAVVSNSAGGILLNIPLGSLYSAASVSNIVRAEMGLTVNLGASVSSGVSTYGKAGILYVINSSVSFEVAVAAALLKIDNLRNLDGTGAITNIISAAMHVRKPLGGVVELSVQQTHKFVVANTIDANKFDGTYSDVVIGYATASVVAPTLHLDDVEVLLEQEM